MAMFVEGPVLVLRDGEIGRNFERYSGFYENIRRDAGSQIIGGSGIVKNNMARCGNLAYNFAVYGIYQDYQ